MVDKIQEQKLLKRKRKAELSGNQNTLASTCIDLGEFYDKEGRYEDGIAEFLIVADIYKKMGKLLDYGRACRAIGEAFVNLNEFEKALEYQQIYLEIAKDQSNKPEEQRALATIGHIHLTQYLNEVDSPNQHSLHLASKAFVKSLSICESLTDIKRYKQKDMTARLFANLGLVYECKGEYEKAVELFEKSIAICKTHDLFEQLQRSHTCLGTLYARKEEYDAAIRQYNLAMEVAGRLKNKTQLISASLQSKADVLIKMADFYGAKIQLMKAYKLQPLDGDDKKVVEQNLKIVAAMCKAEESLLTTDGQDYKRKKALYEKLGDGASHLNNFSYAIRCYKKMLKAAINNKETGSRLSSCYISLAETYRDNKQYNMAIKYFREDFNINDDPKEQISTLLSIADCMNVGHYDVSETSNTYEEARLMCRTLVDVWLESKVLTSYISFLKKRNIYENITELEQQLGAINKSDYETDSETTEVVTPNIGDEIRIEDLTDVSDDSEGENCTTKRRTKGYVIKRNNKGETQLHTACIQGNLELVKRLLDQKHPVNVRDNCGWLPIHEACICGHLEIVQLLIKNGASINDRGGTYCQGTSPLHDAALNGHLEVVQLLLDSGASSFAKNDSGQIPLHVLKMWRSDASLDCSEEDLYNKLVERLSVEAEKLSLPKESDVSPVNSAFVTHAPEEIVLTQKKKVRHRRYSHLGNLSKEDDKNPSSHLTDTIQNEYKRVIEQMRHPTRAGSTERKRKSNENVRQSVYVESDNEIWLENDTVSVSKKRKTCLVDSSKSSRSRQSIHSIMDDDDDDGTNDVINVDNLSSRLRSSQNKKMKKKQTSLLDSGFTRSPSVDSNCSSHSGCSSSPTKFNNYDTHKELDTTSNTVDIKNVFNTEPILSVDVRINGKLYKVPVPASEIYTRTIKWLAEEASLRFSRKECMKPNLELETTNGAVLADDDFISVLFSAGLAHAEQVEARVTKWNVVPLVDRYTEACSTEGVVPSDELKKILQRASQSLNLSNLHLGDKTVEPLCRVINRQINLCLLNLSGNCLHNSSFHLLCRSLPTLENLSDLNLSLNQLTWVSLQQLNEVFLQSSVPILINLTKLNLSHNPLGNESLRFLGGVTRHLKLKTLQLADVDFTNTIFSSGLDLTTHPNLEFVSNLDISYNQLGNNEIATFLSWLKPCNVESLNVSDCTEVAEGLLKIVTSWIQISEDVELNLKVLNFSRTCATDAEVMELLRRLKCRNQLFSIDLSYNTSLTTKSFKSVLECCPLVHCLNFTGCDNVIKDLEWCAEEQWNNLLIRELKLSGDLQNCSAARDSIIRMWKRIHTDLAQIRESTNFLHFTLIK